MTSKLSQAEKWLTENKTSFYGKVAVRDFAKFQDKQDGQPTIEEISPKAQRIVDVIKAVRESLPKPEPVEWVEPVNEPGIQMQIETNTNAINQNIISIGRLLEKLTNSK